MGLARGGRALPSDHHGSPTLGGARSAYSGECAGIATESGIGGQYVTHVLDQVGLLKTECRRSASGGRTSARTESCSWPDYCESGRSTSKPGGH